MNSVFFSAKTDKETDFMEADKLIFFKTNLLLFLIISRFLKYPKVMSQFSQNSRNSKPIVLSETFNERIISFSYKILPL